MLAGVLAHASAWTERVKGHTKKFGMQRVGRKGERRNEEKLQVRLLLLSAGEDAVRNIFLSDIILKVSAFRS